VRASLQSDKGRKDPPFSVLTKENEALYQNLSSIHQVIASRL
jgi:hypothetical protein